LKDRKECFYGYRFPLLTLSHLELLDSLHWSSDWCGGSGLPTGVVALVVVVAGAAFFGLLSFLIVGASALFEF
jgi:hypothetical protein